MLARCSDCGRLINTDCAEFVDGGYICGECLENTVECSVCGERHLRSNCIEFNGAWWCIDCRDGVLTTCADCGKWIRIDGSHEKHDGTRICEECLNNNSYSVCECCGRLVGLFDDYHSVHTLVSGVDTIQFWCDECYHNFAWTCADCESQFDGRLIHFTDTSSGDIVCDTCRDNNFVYCGDCGMWHRRDFYNFTTGRCGNCQRIIERATLRRNLIHSYHSSEDSLARHTWFGDALPSWGGIWRGVGLELEIDRDCRAEDAEVRLTNKIMSLVRENEVFFERDCSLLNGFEIITAPHTVESFNEWVNDGWDSILKACRDEGYESHDAGTCGLHMHFSRELFGNDRETQDVAIAKLVQFYELYYDEILKVSRRTRSQAERWANRYGIVDREDALDIARTRRGGHSIAINNANAHTVEIRLTRGTLNYTTFKACTDFMMTVVRNSVLIGWSDTTDATAWLNGLKPETISYCRRVGAFTSALNRMGARG